MSYYHNDFENTPEYANFHHRFLGKPLFWQDIMEGLFDTHLFEKKMSDHYANTAKAFVGRENDEKWGYLYDLAYKVMDYLAEKTYIAENLVPAYLSGDKELLRKIAEIHLPALKEKTVSVHMSHKNAWFRNNKIIGWQNLDIRYGGVVARCDTAIMLIEQYLNGDLDTLEELDEKRLHKGLGGFITYSAVATVNKKI